VSELRSVIVILSAVFFLLPAVLCAAQGTTSQGILLISIDGFSQQYWHKYQAPTLHRLAKEGTRAQSMQPAFPTKTFPNHYSIVTGLHPANHGIVENNIYDAGFDAVFRLNKPDEVRNGRWWLGEPVWVTAEKQGVKTATYFYPGSEAAIGGIRPSLWQPYDGGVSNTERVMSVLRWLDLPADQRPKFLTLYFSTVDDAGHAYGPDSAQVAKAIMQVDQALAVLLDGLKQRGLYGKLDLMLVSDHGMAAVPEQQVIILDKLFETSKAALTLWTPEIVSIFPKPGEMDVIYQQLKLALPQQATVYKKADLPARWHYQNSKRIAPIVVVPEPGWRLMQGEKYRKWLNEPDKNPVTGSHGYDNNNAQMQAVFIGNGPSFAKGAELPPFANIELYNLMCRILAITPAANDGNPEWLNSVYKPAQNKQLPAD